MKHKIFFTTLSALLVTGAAWAAHPEGERAYTVSRIQVEEVQKLAREVENRARGVHRGAERYANHGDYREQQALARLHELETRARHFHFQVKRYEQNINHAEADFRDLRRAYSRASYAMHDLHAFRKIDRQLDRLSDAMYELEMYAGDLFYGARPTNYRYRHRQYRDWYRDWDDDSDSHWRRSRRRARIVLPLSALKVSSSTDDDRAAGR